MYHLVKGPNLVRALIKLGVGDARSLSFPVSPLVQQDLAEVDCEVNKASVSRVKKALVIYIIQRLSTNLNYFVGKIIVIVLHRLFHTYLNTI